MSFFRCLPGADALSVFRQQRLLSHLATQGIELSSITAQYLHFVWSDQELSASQVATLEALLHYGEPFAGSKAKRTMYKLYTKHYPIDHSHALMSWGRVKLRSSTLINP